MNSIKYNKLLEDLLNPAIFKINSEDHPRIHAKNLDRRIGYRVSKIENKLCQKYHSYDAISDDSSSKGYYPDTQAWIGLHPAALQTTYNEIYDVLNYLQQFNISKIIDIGAGYGRIGIAMNAFFENCEFEGYEIVKERYNEGRRVFTYLNYKNCYMYNKNVLLPEFSFPEGDVYFMYDFSEIEDLSYILDQILLKMCDKKYFMITKGDRLKHLMSGRYKEFWANNSYKEFGELRIYSSHYNFAKE